MSGDVHQPLLSQLKVFDYDGSGDRQWQRARCFCGWHGEWRTRAWRVGRDMNEHMARERAAIARPR